MTVVRLDLDLASGLDDCGMTTQTAIEIRALTKSFDAKVVLAGPPVALHDLEDPLKDAHAWRLVEAMMST